MIQLAIANYQKILASFEHFEGFLKTKKFTDMADEMLQFRKTMKRTVILDESVRIHLQKLQAEGPLPVEMLDDINTLLELMKAIQKKNKYITRQLSLHKAVYKDEKKKLLQGSMLMKRYYHNDESQKRHRISQAG